MEETIHSLEVKNKAKDLINKNLQDKVRNTPFCELVCASLDIDELLLGPSYKFSEHIKLMASQLSTTH